MDTPVDAMIAGAPVEVIITTPVAAGYDADVVDASGGRTTFGTVGIVSKVKEIGLTIDGSAFVTVKVIPPELKIGSSRVRLGGATGPLMTLRGVQTRYWLGTVSGYTLGLD